MDSLVDWRAACPYCGESIDLLIDPTNIGVSYIEDCSVCCRPISILVFGSCDEYDVWSVDAVELRSENE